MSRMFSVASLVLLGSLALAATAPAQPHATGWIFGGVPTGTGPALGHLSPSGAMTTLIAQSALPASTQVEGGAMNAGNRQHLVAVTSKVVHQSVLVVDLTGRILRTLQVSPQPPSQGGYVVDAIADQNGDYIVLEAPGGAAAMALYKFDRTFTLMTLFAGSPLRIPISVTIDVDTGDFIVLDVGRLYRIPPGGSSITTVGQFRVPVLGQVTQDLASGDFFAGSNLATEPGAVIVRMTRTGTASTFLAFGFGSCTAVAADRASAPRPQLAFGVPGTQAGVYFVDVGTQAVTTLTRAAGIRFSQLWADRGRNLSTSSPATDRWAFHVDFPGEAGLAYALGLSLSGVRPGVKLPDGRRIPIQVDILTLLSVNGQLGALLSGHTGVLDPSGAAQAVLNSAPALRGLRIWAVAVTLDPAAPLGLRTISDPVVLNL
jgi:hypothetical protein